MKKKILAVCVLASFSAVCSADYDKLSLQINGISHHFDTDKKYRENNTGVGFQLEESKLTYPNFVSAGTLINSMNDRSWYAGVGQYYPLQEYIKVGYFAGGVTYPSSKYTVLPAVFPIVEFSTPLVSFTFLYAVKVKDSPSVVFLQLKIPIN